LLWGLVNDDQTTMKLERLPVTVTCAALTPKAEYLAWGGADGSVHITDLIARQENIVLRENSSQTSCLAFSTDGRWLASGFADGTIQLWAVDRWDKKEVLAGHSGAIRHLVFHPDAAHLTSIGTDATIRMWNLKDTGETQAIDHPEPKAPNISISSNAKTVATFGGLDNTVRFWQLPEESGDKRYVKLHTLPPQKGIILSVALSTDGSTAIISTHDSLVSRWEIATLKHLAAYSHTVLVNPLALSADGQTLVTARSDNLLKVWDVQTGHEIRTLRGHASTPSLLAISADGQSLASVDSDNTVRVWATGAGEERNRLLHQGIVVFLAVSPDGHTLATSDPNFFKVKLWNLSTRKSIDFFAGERTGHVAFSPDGKWFALLSSGGQLRLWDRSTTPYGSGPSADIGSFAVGNHLTFSHDSKILGFRNRQDEVVVLWDVSARAIMGTLPDNSGSVGAMAFAPTDEVIATASEEKIRLWDVASQRLLAAIPDQHPDTRSICFSPDGQLLAATSGDTELRWWDVSVPAQPHALAPLRGHTAHIVAVAFSPDGKTLATGGWDSTLRLWNVSSKQQVAILRDHSSVVQSLAWSPDGNTIYTGSGDASVRIWRAPSWEQIEAAEQIPASLAVRD
jgi:WD40 repeat protein